MSIVDKLKAWLVRPVDRVVLQVPRALVASILCAFLDCGYMVFLVQFCDWHPVSAAILSYTVGGVLQYVLCSVWVFPASPHNKAMGFLAFTILSLVGLGITWFVMTLGESLSLPYGFSKFIALGLAFVWNFTSRKVFLFVKKPPQTQDDEDLDKFDDSGSYEWVNPVANITTVRS